MGMPPSSCPKWASARAARRYSSICDSPLNPFYDEGMQIARGGLVKWRWLSPLVLIAACLPAAGQGIAISGASATPLDRENVLLVINGNSAESRDVGEYYRQKRAIPEGNVCKLSVQASESVDRATFDRAIGGPIAEGIDRKSTRLNS